jgi:serine phosphatase RsbU (regulator of sigma subunit)
VASLIQSAILRGMVRMVIQRDFHPLKMLHSLNQTLNQDPMDQHFGLCFLMLNPDKDQLSFVSCSYSNLWHLPEGSKKVRTLATPNPALGADPAATLLETADNWNSGDTLILHSLGVASKEDPSWITEHDLLSPQPQADKILQNLTAQRTSLPKRASAVISIQRIF